MSLFTEIIRKVFRLDACKHPNVNRTRQQWEVEDLLGVGIMKQKYKVVWHCANCTAHGSYWE